MFVRETLLRKIGIDKISENIIEEIKKQRYVCVSCIDGAEVNLNYSLLTADIYLPADLFKKEEIKIIKEEKAAAESLGLYIDYDFIYSDSTTSKYFRGLTEFNLFFGKNVLSQSVLYTNSTDQSKLIRLDTTLVIDDIDNIRRIYIGDIFPQNEKWGSALRLGGIMVATDYSLRPEFITYPLPQFSGEAVLPSSIDIFTDNAKLFSKEIKPGPFEIKDIPIVSPEGNIRVVIKDVLGREKIIEIPYATNQALLKKGLSQYMISAGFVRKNYLIDSFKYHNFITMGTYKYGLTDKLSLEFEAYLDGYDKGNIGFSPYFLLGKFGFLTPSIAVSYDGKQTGYLYGVDYTKSFKYLKFRFTGRNNSESFVQPGTVIGLPKSYYNTLLSFTIPEFGSLNFSYIKREYIDTSNSENFNISYNKSLFKKLTLNAVYNKYKTGSSSYSTYGLSLSMPLGSEHRASFRTQSNRNDQTYTLELSKNVSSYKGLGYSIRAAKANGYQTYFGRFNYSTNFSNLYLDFSYSDIKRSDIKDTIYYRLGMTGSVAYMEGNLFFKRSVKNSFALVKIDPPVKGVEIIANNRPVGKTDKNGTVFIEHLAPYYRNEIRINPSSLDMKTLVDKTVYSFVPLKKHGYLLKFKSKKVNSVRLKIKFPDGSFPEAGLRFDVDDKINAGILGYNGKAFIENITAGKHIVTVDYGYGLCSFELNIKEEWLEKIVPFVGEYICVPQTGGVIVEEDKKKKKLKVQPSKRKKPKLKRSKKVSYKKQSDSKKNSGNENINKITQNGDKNKTYTIEVGSFNKEDLNKAVEEYEEFKTEVVKDGEIYRIYIGRFKTLEDAEKFKNIFKIKGKIRVVRE